MKTVISNVIRISDPTAEITNYCKNSLTLANPEYIKKQRMGLWTGRTPQVIRLYERDGRGLILPYGCVDDLRDMPGFLEPDTVFGFSDPVRVSYSGEVPLYDYQQKAMLAMMTAGHGILQAPAGAGKTQIGIALAMKSGRRALWLTHTADLLEQSKNRALMYTDAELIGTITAGKADIGEGITFATIQTMCRLDLDRLRDMWDVIIVDECHRAAGTPTAATQFSKVLNALSARHKYGMSATVHRSDGLIAATFALLGNVAYRVPDEAAAERIMPVTVKPVGTGIGISPECQNTDGTINYTGMISYLCGSQARNGVITARLIEEKNHSCLILSDRLGHLETLMNALPEDMKKDAAMISGRMTSKKGRAERASAIERMRTGQLKYLFATYSLAKEGLDIPRIDRLLLTTPHKDYAVVTQAIGRAARKADGKTDPLCLDFVDSIGYLRKAFTIRCRYYKKAGCRIIADT